ncbi:YqiA/YcfP family alpha/beta fold hydrolase [Flavobacterium sp. K5-23]|uniref:YqiA/YcfP family alpha/beta fold hydrolase n=1 Tax=Flavobacterium sp. K5-23 TaxID=2746225 RepID=UPI00200BBEFE|nr:YqiA/YcfP family alpha/beta fold hydrolase [Flavobacterium sp. K5-23]UQD57219.1 alpha/beta hydrolase [Flavobacterium sp. K5-23]
MNILYLHGLESKLSEPKRVILEAYGNVIAPDIDYKSNPNMIQNLYDEYHNQDINVIIGSSMGGFAAYHLANSLGLCALLYNPALPYRSNIEQIIPATLPVNNASFMRIVLGAQDVVIKAKDNLNYLAQYSNSTTDYDIRIKRELAHQIPVEIFEQETKTFFEVLSY